ncbi:hypothetical protein TSAR_003429 [Trichomalopsis sarcophagae]|uniref:Uncharacterized protein n=1 Tax=Trichomalopsis sarcophagae TaxID=543379 RepID=A0A232EEW1_9HYME|nr:hypothetical protein TSAR_003429 [Trichomalopsis sarcophagae]
MGNPSYRALQDTQCVNFLLHRLLAQHIRDLPLFNNEI